MDRPSEQRSTPSWHWPEAASSSSSSSSSSSTVPGSYETHFDRPPSPAAEAAGNPNNNHNNNPKTYPSRTCRICLETVPPTYHPASENIPSFLQAGPRVSYDSEDPSLGRLIRPCKCKGSSRYVHEGCLRQWRHADPGYGRRNYWQCPTCGFQYRLERMAWGRWISSASSQILVTVVILMFVMFALGFVADPIINLYIDPYDTIITSTAFWDKDADPHIIAVGGAKTWTEHFVKGLASLGVLSFLKVVFALSPWQWWNLRNSGLLGGGRGGRRGGATGRDRVASISWLVIVIGVATFLWGVYKGVRAWSCRVLESAGQRVMDVSLDEDDDDDDDDDEDADRDGVSRGQDDSSKKDD
ncbi:hypothetical protein LOZ61_003570 [Ophidiomyces ophidiicola]|nr:hypothetical protein LOZ61_003570 [Ophidiomyces ophidiicola]KAI1925576.1 hypothetical protein LOZ60_004092 [Ophidiomyces ophidiicola]KAI1926896.1 hypothetical protein LOZ64_000026 [Ophidiomyces ophidiicola]KAI1952534.1 hypothetical protein LOZ59_005341 [Ophidiomyces ophidiicola]KAI1969565.1 hypothetical protein LOZ56_004350 [Ophidiomyces ophidiicola]